MIVLDNENELGDIVYLKTDVNQYPRMVTAFKYSGGGITYQLSSGTLDCWHFGIEVSKTRDGLLKSENS
jgi:hypothetical protein